MEAGGRTIDCATNDGGDPNSTRFPMVMSSSTMSMRPSINAADQVIHT
jgi:hypothetical protein